MSSIIHVMNELECVWCVSDAWLAIPTDRGVKFTTKFNYKRGLDNDLNIQHELPIQVMNIIEKYGLELHYVDTHSKKWRVTLK